MSLRVVARTRLLLVFGCVFFAVFKSSGVPPPGAESVYLPCMQQSVPPERYLDDWGDHLFHHTFTRLTQRLRLGALLHPATLRGQRHAIQQFYCPIGLVRQLRNISTVSCRGDGNCGWHSLLNGNCRFLGQRTSYEHPIGDIRRPKAKVADNIVHHVTAGRALSVADLQRQCAAPGGSPPLRLFMGQRARTMGFEIYDSIDRLKRFSDFEGLLQHNFLADRR